MLLFFTARAFGGARSSAFLLEHQARRRRGGRRWKSGRRASDSRRVCWMGRRRGGVDGGGGCEWGGMSRAGRAFQKVARRSARNALWARPTHGPPDVREGRLGPPNETPSCRTTRMRLCRDWRDVLDVLLLSHTSHLQLHLHLNGLRSNVGRTPCPRFHALPEAETRDTSTSRPPPQPRLLAAEELVHAAHACFLRMWVAHHR